MKKFIIFLLSVFFLSETRFAYSLETYKNKAVVSYYAEKYHGRKTASGETFNMHDMTCAHKILPFNTVLRITNLANGKSVDVRVNDRGPFVAGREVDLSKAAAQKLDMIKSGTANVKIQIVKMGANTKQSVQTAAKASKMGGGSSSTAAKTTTVKKGVLYDIQIASFGDENNARDFAKKVAAKKIKNVALQKSNGNTRVMVIKVDGKDVNSVLRELSSSGYSNCLVKERI